MIPRDTWDLRSNRRRDERCNWFWGQRGLMKFLSFISSCLLFLSLESLDSRLFFFSVQVLRRHSVETFCGKDPHDSLWILLWFLLHSLLWSHLSFFCEMWSEIPVCLLCRDLPSRFLFVLPLYSHTVVSYYSLGQQPQTLLLILCQRFSWRSIPYTQTSFCLVLCYFLFWENKSDWRNDEMNPF